MCPTITSFAVMREAVDEIMLNGGKFAGKTNQGKSLPEKLRYWIES